jgi:hypothetical protein
MVQPGTNFFKRKILILNGQSRYFATLATEGGLPLKLLSRERDAHLQRYLRALLREFQVYGVGTSSAFDLASRIGSQLPKSLQHPGLFQLCGDLVQRIWQLQSKLGDTSTPIEDLDQMEADWRNSFPLVVSDEVAEVLLNSLVKEAVKIARIQEIQFEAFLKKSSTGYQLYRSPKLPSYFSAESLAKMLGTTINSLPFRVHLHLSHGGMQKQLLALVSKRKAEDDARYAVETPKEPFTLENAAAVGSLWVEARFTGITHEVRDLKGSSALSELPWTFISKDGVDDRLTLIGEASLKTKHSQVFVASPLNYVPSIGEGICEPIGELLDSNRLIYKISGFTTFKSDDGLVSICTGAEEEENCQYIIYGDLLSAGAFGSNIYKGVPRIKRYMETGPFLFIPSEKLQWKPKRTNKDWAAVSEDCCGKVTLRHVVNGEILYMTDLDIVPKSTSISFMPGAKSGSIFFTGLGTCDIGIESEASVVVTSREQEADSCRMSVAATAEQPAVFKLYVRWDEYRSVSLNLPFPARGGRFIGRDGHVLAADEKIHIDQLDGYIAQFMAPTDNKTYCLEAAVSSREGVPESLQGQLILYGIKLRQLASGQHELDLQALHDGCNLLFSTVDSLDAVIRVGIVTTDGAMAPSNRVSIARFDMSLSPDRETGEVFIPEKELKYYGEAVAERLTIKAFPLYDPCVEPVILSRTGTNRWQFVTETVAPGPWLITGWDGDWCRLRPLCFPVITRENSEIEYSEDITFDNISRMFIVKDRLFAFDKFVGMLADSPEHTDWIRVDACIEYLNHLPSTTFDVVKRLVRNNDAVCMALLRANENNFESIWNGFEHLPFAWYLVPLKSWLKSAKSRLMYLQNALEKLLPDNPDLPLESLLKDSLNPFINQAPARMRGFSPIAELILHKIFNVSLDSLMYLRMGSAPQFRSILTQSVLEGEESALQALLQQHADDYWPSCLEITEDWWPQNLSIVPVELHGLWQKMSFQSAVVNAPVVAALSVTFSIELSENLRFHLRRIREFDIAWFNVYYGCVLSSSVGYLIESNQEVSL